MKSEGLLLSTSAGTKSLSKHFAVSGRPYNLHDFATCTRAQSTTQKQSACCPVGFNTPSNFIDEQHERCFHHPVCRAKQATSSRPRIMLMRCGLDEDHGKNDNEL